MKFTQENIIKIAKRENNTKRSFLLVNPFQGKHIHVSPSVCFMLFNCLAQKLFEAVDLTENTIIIGFAETATAIGASLAAYPDKDIKYINTTRENTGHEYLFFSEEHSHATEQKLDKDFMDKNISAKTNIIFAEDEVTTGKTIMNIINILKKNYTDVCFNFFIASLLNGMEDEKISAAEKNNIHCFSLFKVPKYNYDEILSKYTYDDSLKHDMHKRFSEDFKTENMENFGDTRCGVNIKEYTLKCTQFSKTFAKKLSISSEEKILILGTEEFMYAPMVFGNFIEKEYGCTVSFHATTRSPILPSGEKDYPVNKRYCLPSFYDENRITYIYNIEKYSRVLVFTDSVTDNSAMKCLCSALKENGCSNITYILWRNK